MGIGPEGVRSASVSRAKFDQVKDKLKKVQVHENNSELKKRNSHSLCVCVCVYLLAIFCHTLTLIHPQEENDHLRATNEQLQMKLDELQKQMNKIIEENVRLRSTQPRSPTTPTSPLPVIMEPPGPVEEEDPPMEVYAQVDMSKVSIHLSN